MSQGVRLFLVLEGAIFVAAALLHLGLIIDGYQDQAAAIAESLIATVLLVGLLLTLGWPTRTGVIGLAAQTFALLVTLVGAFTIAAGFGPSTTLDVLLHGVMLITLAAGVTFAARAPLDRRLEA